MLVALLVVKDDFGYDPIGETTIQGPSSELLTPVFSLRRAPKLLTSPLANQKLQDEINLLLDALPDSACLAISSPLERIYDYQTGIPLVPGGTQKILTSYAAIKQLGASFQYETIIAAERETDEDGNLLSSDLYVFGGGDPLLRTDSYTELLPESYSQIRTSADELADLTVGMNVLFVQGAVVVNETRYDEERTVPGWSPELQESSVIGSLSAALLDGGYDGLKQNYSSQRGVEDPPPLVPSVNPAKRFAANFDDLLEARSVIILKAAKETNDVQLIDLVELLSIKSPTLDQILKQMLTNDDTITAEMVLKEIGYSRTGEGKTSTGLVSIPEIISGSGITETGILLVDGSGLSTGNQLTCEIINSILEESDTKEIFTEALPIAGEEGIVAKSFIGTAFESNLNAYSVQTPTYASVAGYFTTPNGTKLTITFLANSTIDDATFEQRIQLFFSGLGDALSTYSGGQPLDELGPLQD